MTDTSRRYLRFPVAYRVEHWLFMASFTTLAVTGLAQKFALAGVSEAVIALLGGIESVRVIHRVAAVTMMLEAVYHVGAVAYRAFVRRTRLNMLPSLNDVRLAVQSLLYNLGLTRSRPQQGRYTFEEKIEYWAVVWGTLIMVLTGFMLWNPIATTSVLPGEAIPAAKAAHSNEALLAVLAIIIWHMYHVLVRTRNKSMFTGYVSEEEMIDEHPLELADLKSGVAERPVDPQAAAGRRRIFFGVYGVVAAAALVGIYVFVTFEQTAIATVPPAENVTVFAPLTPTPLPTLRPTSTPAPTQPASGGASAAWNTGISEVFAAKCGACHGAANALGGLNLSMYQSALAGGKDGPVITPGNPDASPLVALQTQGGHPGQLGSAELEQVIAWIAAGAPESAGSAATPSSSAGAADTWADLQPIIAQRCAACHVNAALGGLSLKTYADALKGGSDGPAIVTGDPGASALIRIQSQGGHPGQLTADELARFTAWIAAGAPEK